MNRLTLKTVNKALAAAGIKDELVKGKDYFYFWGDKASEWHSSSVMVPRLSDLTVEEWVKEYRTMEKMYS
jgi:hypothetical protein